MDWFLTQNLC